MKINIAKDDCRTGRTKRQGNTVTGTMLSDDLMLPDASARSNHPMDSSRIMLGLTTLYRKAEASEPGRPDSDSIDGVISKGVLRSLLSALHFRDVTTVRHTRRVAQLAVGMANYLGWDGRSLKVLEVASLLHDVGKIGVPDNILFKPGSLSPDEAELMALHHAIGVDVLQACRVDAEVLEIVTQANSHYCGTADGLRRKQSDIHQGARILAVADAYESLASDQIYREAKPHDEIMKILMESAGKQFDGNMVCALARWTESNGMPFEAAASESHMGDQLRGPEQTEDAIEANSLSHIFSYLYLLESLYDGFYLVDSDLRFAVWNGGAEKLLGTPAQEVLGQVWNSRILNYADKYGQPIPDELRPMAAVIESGKATTNVVQLQRPDGRGVIVELQTVPLFDETGRLHGVAEIFRDMSRSHRRDAEYAELRMAATRDALTSVANRGELETQLAMMVSDFSKDEVADPFSVIFLDVDHFKKVNDNHGHSVGDEVLVEVARILESETYSGELVGRYGGEEFVILCPETPLDQALRRAERLRLSICATKIAGLNGNNVTASFGVTEMENGDSVESLLRRADKALYQAKETGRNQSCSLTNQELLAGDESREVAKKQEAKSRFRFSESFSACIASDMVVYKLGGFVSENNAKLLEVTPKRVVIRLGVRGMLSFWGKNDDKRPVKVELEFTDEKNAEPKRGGSTRVTVDVRIRPIGWVSDNDVFQGRARRVLKALKSYFVADFET